MPTKLRAGASKTDITPEGSVALAGFKARQGLSQGVHDRLYVSTLLLDNGEKKLAIISGDIIGLDSDFVAEARDLIAGKINIPAGNVMITATHTHSGPLTVDASYGDKNKSYLSLLKSRMLKTIVMAEKNMRAACIGIGTGRVKGVGVNRRDLQNGITDTCLGVIMVKDRMDNIFAVLANYCCHPTVLGPDNLLISADYPGYLREGLEKRWGKDVVILFANGVCGDVNPGHSAEVSALGGYISGRTFERAQELGKILADSAASMKISHLSDEVRLATASKRIKAHLRNFPSPEEAEKALKAKQNALAGKEGKKLDAARVDLLYAELLLAKARERKTVKEDWLEMEIQSLKIGDTVLLGLPVELFVEVGLSIKRKSPFKNTFMVGYANGYMGYVPSEKAWGEGGYETAVARFIPRTAGKIEAESVKMLSLIPH